LRRDGVLDSSEIQDIQVDASPSTNAHIARIQIEYASGPQGDAPRSLILKTVDASGAGFVKDSEFNYYTRDYLDLADAPVPKCYAAHIDPDHGSYSILMEDMTSTHEKDTSPSFQYGLEVASALARLHAFGFGEERVQKLDGRISDKARLDRYIGHVRLGLDSLLEETGTDLPDLWRETVLDIFENHPGKMWERTNDPTGFTIVHGDVNPGNILYPVNGGRVYFLDRQPFTWSLTTWLGVSDLSYLMVQYWDTERRRDLEMSVLEEYHRQLIDKGVSDYSWEQLLADYKLCIPQAVYTVAEWCIQDRDRMGWLWRLELERAMHAFLDWGCNGLWAQNTDRER
jgi:aminoglycoside phosphotransferase (APT) family kinase protein